MTQQNSQVSEGDMELLSAYLDKQLPEAERRALRARIEREPVLRTALDELGATVMLLRELPPLMPPRSFTIDTATVQPRPWLSLGLLRFGSTFAALLFVVALVVDVSNSGVSIGASSPQNSVPASAAMEQRSAPEASAPTAAAAESANAVVATAATAASVAAGDATANQQAENTSATGSTDSTAGGAADAQATAETSASILSVPANGEPLDQSAQEVGPAADTAALQEQKVVETLPAPTRPIRIIEAALALAAVAFALSAWWLRRRAQ